MGWRKGRFSFRHIVKAATEKQIMIANAIYTAIIGFMVLFLVMGILVFSVKWMYVLNLLDKARVRGKLRRKNDAAGK